VGRTGVRSVDGCIRSCEGGPRGDCRRTPGCLDFSLSADLLEPGRINIFERWESVAAVEAFRGSGTSDEQSAAILAASVAEYDARDERSLT
jgi:quinol monooxygenase YgiN